MRNSLQPETKTDGHGFACIKYSTINNLHAVEMVKETCHSFTLTEEKEVVEYKNYRMRNLETSLVHAKLRGSR